MNRVLAVVVDRARARFFDVGPTATVELPCLHSPATRGGRFHSDREDAPGRGEHAYHGRIREESRRHLAAIVARVAAVERRNPATEVLVAGPPRTTRTLCRVLSSSLGGRVIGTANLDAAIVTPAVVRRAAKRLSEAHERDTQRALVAAVQEGVGRGRAEIGIRAVLRSLAQGRVRALLVRADVRGAGYRCADSNRLVLSRADCRGEGDPLRVPDLLTAAADEARRQGAAVMLIADPDIAKPIDDLAALLRF